MIDPVALKIGPLSIHWYGIAYATSLLICLLILVKLNKKARVFKDKNQIFDFLFWIFLIGVLLGGRLGYVLFYNLPYYLANPAKIIAVWEGGMSFHGGLIGSLIVAYILAKKYKINLVKMMDLMVVPGALATALPRIANFINRELYGRVIESESWKWLGVDFGDGHLRFPSQLFQSAGAVALFLIMLFLYSRKPKKGVLLFSYLTLYGAIRIFLEFWRQPDEQIGFLFGFFSLGQLLSLAMLIAGLAGLYYVKKK
jgi:phosphatidylglycerol:prolipoprotein diacylglycerol transferase